MQDFLQEVPKRLLPVFIYTIKNAGESVLQAESKVYPSTLIPDMDNAIVGSQNKIDIRRYP